MLITCVLVGAVLTLYGLNAVFGMIDDIRNEKIERLQRHSHRRRK